MRHPCVPEPDGEGVRVDPLAGEALTPTGHHQHVKKKLRKVHTEDKISGQYLHSLPRYGKKIF